MEAGVGGEAQIYYGLPPTELRAVGKRSLEWDPNSWKWDGHLFLATRVDHNSPNYQGRQFFPLEIGNTATRDSSNSSSSCSEELNQGIEKEKRELEKRRRPLVVEDDNLANDGSSLILKLGGIGYTMMDNAINGEGTTGKKAKLAGATSNRAICQVQDCGADLSKAKDYHRRHKVCEMHSKATRALVGNQMQRFCQQCSRFHALQEFDEGKRSCRRRLAGHNKRRRKSQPDSANNNSPLNDNQASGYLLMSLLKILSNMHSNRSNHKDDQDLLSHLLHSLASQGSLHGETSVSGRAKELHNLPNNLPSLGNSEFLPSLLANASQGQRPREQLCITPAHQMPRKDENLQATTSIQPVVMFPSHGSSPADAEGKDCSAGRSKLNNFDLNDVYVDSDDGMEDLERSPVPVDLGASSIELPLWMQQDSHQSSPPQTTGNSDSGSAQSPSTSSGDGQSRTDRIVFKLFGKEPSDFPVILRAQIFDWLSHSPTDIESYIRPGCIILTIYLCLSESAWEEICCDLRSSLSRLLEFYHDVSFWSTGWIYVTVQNQIAFIYNGQVVVDTSLPFNSSNYSKILSVKPIAVTSSERAQFIVKGYNLSRPSTRLLSLLEGNYLEANSEVMENVGGSDGHDVQYLNFACSVPPVNGRGFIEVEDHCLCSNFFPFIVAEDDVCSEMRMLEKEIELTETDGFQLETGKLEARNQVMDFIHEMGWLLHRNNLKSRMGHSDLKSDCFSFKRFKFLVEFSVDHDWCAVLNKLLNILFNGTVGAGERPFLKFVLYEMGLLHRAVRRNSRSLVEMLLKYSPERVADELSSEYNSLTESDRSVLFRPDVVGPAGLTPLHIAAGRDGSEDVLDALTCDPGKVGIEAWKNARDSTGFTPEDYARLRGHYSYIHLIQRKITKKVSSGHVVVDIAGTCSESSVNQKKHGEATTGFEIRISKRSSIQQPCGICDQNLVYRTSSRTLLYKPAMLSMVAIAAVCVCVALLFKSSPQVLYVFRPFRWEMLEFGSS